MIVQDAPAAPCRGAPHPKDHSNANGEPPGKTRIKKGDKNVRKRRTKIHKLQNHRGKLPCAKQHNNNMPIVFNKNAHTPRALSKPKTKRKG